jgi:hypothetical protein
MVLGYSRHMFAQIVFDQKTETWLRLHAEAFRHFGAVPRTVVPDNLKAAVVRAAFGIDDDSELNRSYRELARHYGFRIDPTPPRAAEKKGKVESGVKYVKHNALAGRAGQDVAEARAALARWTMEIAGTRRHGTTGKPPLELFDKHEKEHMLSLPSRPFELVVWKRALVHRDCHVQFDGRLYSVPWRLVGKEVWIRATASGVVAYHEDAPIARHDRRRSGWRSTLDEHLPDYRAPLRHRSRAFWEERAAKLGDDVAQLVRDVFDQDDVLFQLRRVQMIVTHLEKFPADRAQAACRRARRFGAITFQAVRDILRRGLDFEPEPDAPPSAWDAAPPKFARDTRSLALARIVSNGGNHGPH